MVKSQGTAWYIHTYKYTHIYIALLLPKFNKDSLDDIQKRRISIFGQFRNQIQMLTKILETFSSLKYYSLFYIVSKVEKLYK